MKRVFLVFAFVLLCTDLSSAQESPNLEQGLKPFGSYHDGGIDNISLSSGGIQFRIPLWSKPQRGRIPTASFLEYQSKQWGVEPACDTYTCFPKWGLTRQIGVNYRVAPETITSCTAENPGWYDNPNVEPVLSCSALGRDQSFHQLAKMSAAVPTFDFRAVDGSGLEFHYAGTSVDQNNVIHMLGSTSDDKAVATWTDQSSSPWYNFITSDSNGNFVIKDLANSNVYDTLNATIPGPQWQSAHSECVGPLPDVGSTTKLYAAIPGYSGQSNEIKVCYGSLNASTSFPDVSGTSVQQFNLASGQTAMVVQSAILPDGSAWRFEYNNYGEVTKLTFPTGGSISYTYTAFAPCRTELDPSVINHYNTPQSRFITSRVVDAADGTSPKTTGYQWTIDPDTSKNAFWVIVTDASGNQTRYHEEGIAGTCSFFETSQEIYQGSLSTGRLLRSETNDYDGTVSQLWANAYDRPAINVVKRRTTTTNDDGTVKKIEYDYDGALTFYEYQYVNSNWQWVTYQGTYGLEKSRREYDYGVGQAGTLLRTTATIYAYEENSAYSQWPAQMSLKASTELLDSNQQRAAYDHYWL